MLEYSSFRTFKIYFERVDGNVDSYGNFEPGFMLVKMKCWEA